MPKELQVKTTTTKGKHKNIIIFGSPGSGKTTQVDMLKDAGIEFSLVSVGQILRDLSAKGSPLAAKIEETMSKGDLVDDYTIIRLVKDRMRDIDKSKMIILDGYPRNLAQVNVVDEIFTEEGLDLPIMINVKISAEEAIKRLSSRRICSKCKEVYNLEIDNLKDSTKCPKCGGELVQRHDDKEEVIRNRFEVFDMQMEIVTYYFRSKGRYFEINGEKRKENTHKEIMKIIGSR